MILYPLETLKTFDIKDIMIISGGDALGGFTEFLKDGSEYGVNLTYRVQEEAGGIAQALSLGEGFAAGAPVMVILGDNIFDNTQFADAAGLLSYTENNALLFLKKVEDPQRFGVPVFNASGSIIEIEEKPEKPKSHYAVTGLYYYPPDVFNVIKPLQPSRRGELEISDVNNFYIHQNRCKIATIDGFWSDAGTHDSLMKSAIWASQNYPQPTP